MDLTPSTLLLIIMDFQDNHQSSCKSQKNLPFFLSVNNFKTIHKGVFSYELFHMSESFASNGFHTFILRDRYPTPCSNKSKSF